MRQRGISVTMVELCITAPDRDKSLDDLCRCVKKLNRRVLIVVYKKFHNEVLVITAYISTKIRKYLG